MRGAGFRFPHDLSFLVLAVATVATGLAARRCVRHAMPPVDGGDANELSGGCHCARCSCSMLLDARALLLNSDILVSSMACRAGAGRVGCYNLKLPPRQK